MLSRPKENQYSHSGKSTCSLKNKSKNQNLRTTINELCFLGRTTKRKTKTKTIKRETRAQTVSLEEFCFRCFDWTGKSCFRFIAFCVVCGCPEKTLVVCLARLLIFYGPHEKDMFCWSFVFCLFACCGFRVIFPLVVVVVGGGALAGANCFNVVSPLLAAVSF